MATSYFLYAVGQLYWWIIVPLTVVRINTSEYECSDTGRSMILFFHTWHYLVWPLSFQLMFFGVSW